MNRHQRKKKLARDFTVIVDEDSVVMPPKNRNLVNPMITFRTTQSDCGPPRTINMPRNRNGNVHQRPKDVSISFDKRIEFGQAGPSTEKVIHNDVKIKDRKPRNRLFEALGVKKPIIINQAPVKTSVVSKLPISNPFLVAKHREEQKKQEAAKAALTEVRTKRSVINPILPPGIDKPVAEKRAVPTVIATVRKPSTETTLTVVRPPIKPNDQTTAPTQQPSSATVDTPTSSDTSEADEMLRIFPKKQTYDPEKMTTSDKEKMQQEIFATRKRKFEQNSQTNPSALPPHLLQPIKRKVVENPRKEIELREEKSPRKEEKEKTIEAKPDEKKTPVKDTPKEESFVPKEQKEESHEKKQKEDLDKTEMPLIDPPKYPSFRIKKRKEDPPQRKQDYRKREIARKSVEKESRLFFHAEQRQFSRGSDRDAFTDRKRENHRREHNHDRSQTPPKRSSPKRLSENELILKIRVVHDHDSDKEGKYSSRHRSYHNKHGDNTKRESRREESPLATIREKDSTVVCPAPERGSNKYDRPVSHHRKHDENKKEDARKDKEFELRTSERDSRVFEHRKERPDDSRKRQRDVSPRRDRDNYKRKREEERKVSSYDRPDKKLWPEKEKPFSSLEKSRRDDKHEAKFSRESNNDHFKKDEYKSALASPKVLVAANGRDRIIPFFTNKYVFSNHFPCPGLKINEKSFCCTEQYYMWRKAKFSKNEAAAAAILMSTDPKQMKLIGSSLDKFDSRAWKKVSWKYMLEANFQKYEQFEKFRFELFRTIGGILVEASPSDCWWGVGLDLESEHLKDRHRWKGKNLLGDLLMEIRDRLSHDHKYRDEARRARRCLLVDEKRQ